jgi:hypothetical protein
MELLPLSPCLTVNPARHCTFKWPPRVLSKYLIKLSHAALCGPTLARTGLLLSWRSSTMTSKLEEDQSVRNLQSTCLRVFRTTTWLLRHRRSAPEKHKYFDISYFFRHLQLMVFTGGQEIPSSCSSTTAQESGSFEARYPTSSASNN